MGFMKRRELLTGLTAAVLGGGAYWWLTRPSTPPPRLRPPAAAPPTSASAPPEPTPPPRAAARRELETALGVLEAALQRPAGDPSNPWAMAHGLLGFGPTLRTTRGGLVIEHLGDSIERVGSGPTRAWRFPAQLDGQPVEPHPSLLLKTLLEVGLPLDHRISTSVPAAPTLRALVLELVRSARLPDSDETWRQWPWALSALGLAASREPRLIDAAWLERLTLASVARLELEAATLPESIDPTAPLDPGAPLRLAKERKLGLFGHPCGGFHFIQAVLTAASPDAPELRPRVQRQLGRLLLRYELERQGLTTLLAQHPGEGLLLRTQQLKFFGHLLETLTLARRRGWYASSTEGGRRLDELTLTAAADVHDVVAELARGGVFLRLAEVRAQREQTYLDLVGDGCHALHGLRDALAQQHR